jgi:DUF4097 and DUF4098 domain-containing protein YvlB
MEPRYARRTVLAGAAVGLAGCVGFGGSLSTGSYARFTSVPEGTALVVQNDNGDVNVEVGEVDTVELRVTERTNAGGSALADVDVTTTQSDGRLLVETVGPDRLFRSVSVDIDLSIPADVTLESVETANGDVAVEGTSGDATLASSNGAVEARAHDGTLSLSSSNGDVTARDVTAVREAQTSNGDVDLDVRELAGALTASSSNGEVRVALPADANANVLLRTANGDARVSDFTLSDAEQSRSQVEGRLGEGGPEVRLTSTNGDVAVRARES